MRMAVCALKSGCERKYIISDFVTISIIMNEGIIITTWKGNDGTTGKKTGIRMCHWNTYHISGL
jgi:hypothetical protein